MHVRYEGEGASEDFRGASEAALSSVESLSRLGAMTDRDWDLRGARLSGFQFAEWLVINDGHARNFVDEYEKNTDQAWAAAEAHGWVETVHPTKADLPGRVSSRSTGCAACATTAKLVLRPVATHWSFGSRTTGAALARLNS